MFSIASARNKFDPPPTITDMSKRFITAIIEGMLLFCAIQFVVSIAIEYSKCSQPIAKIIGNNAGEVIVSLLIFVHYFITHKHLIDSATDK